MSFNKIKDTLLSTVYKNFFGKIQVLNYILPITIFLILKILKEFYN